MPVSVNNNSRTKHFLLLLVIEQSGVMFTSVPSRDPLLRSLHDDPRYKNLLAKLGLPGTS